MLMCLAEHLVDNISYQQNHDFLEGNFAIILYGVNIGSFHLGDIHNFHNVWQQLFFLQMWREER